jgi:glycosidase
MIRYFSSDKIDRIRERIRKLYGGNNGKDLVERMDMIVGRYNVGIDPHKPDYYWDQTDNVLITYGDMVQSDGEPPLLTLKRFLNNYLRDEIDTVHILPFFPYSSDDGFSVINYRVVDRKLGKWEDIEALGEHFRLMFDLIINHVSKESDWFDDYLSGIAPARDYFIEVDPDTDLSSVTRPRSTPLLLKTNTRNGVKYLWTTFSHDQIDLNFKNPDVLFEFLNILFWYISKGARIIRLDAIAYLWKEVGTSCIHLSNTHEIVKLLRDIVSTLAPHVLLLTETNVPHEENMGYFGDGDEAHMVYQFSLPPLLLHALHTGNTKYLTDWANELPELEPGMTFLNFTASHDGIGVRPLQGLIPNQEMDDLITRIKERGGKVSTKKNSDGSKSPYELNITYYDALADPHKDDEDLDVARFLCSQIIPMALKGIPAIYFHSITGTRNNYDGVKKTGRARTINRSKWREDHLIDVLSDMENQHGKVFYEYRRLIQIRSRYNSFHPDGEQVIFDLNDKVFALKRTSPDHGESVISITNFTDEDIKVTVGGHIPELNGSSEWKDLIGGDHVIGGEEPLSLNPYQTVWLYRENR